MPLNRRRFLTLAGLASTATLVQGCTPARTLGLAAPPAPWPQPDDGAWHTLNRLTFGPRPDERARAAEIGVDAWIEEQLAPDRLPDWEATRRLQRFNTLDMDNSLLGDVPPEGARHELQAAVLVRAVYSRRQLYEVMVDFWGDHFHVSTLKGQGAWLKTLDDRATIRPHALGNFRDLLWASLHSPAMLKYLDNHENRAGNPNENYARELMELHTLGVDGGYSQRDVEEVARCLTGWSVDEGLFRGQFRFVSEQHDNGEKWVLGQRLPPGGGKLDGERVFEMLLAHPATPQFIARKLVRRLVADEPPAAIVQAAATSFTKTGGDIKAMLRAILHHPDFASAAPKFKRPLRFVAGALRQLDADIRDARPLLEALARMGQPLFQWLTPDGFPDRTNAWTGSLLARWQFALALATQTLPGTTLDIGVLRQRSDARTMGETLNQLGTLLLGAPPPPHTLATLTTNLAADDHALALALLLALPTYQWQ